MILNLTNQNKSEVSWEPIKFPDGQQQVRIDINSHKFFTIQPIHIHSRLNNFMDLELIVCAVKSLRAIGNTFIDLTIPYCLGSRSDRRFTIGENNYLKDVLCPIINSLNLDSVTVLDPHSYVLEACLNNYKQADISEFYKWAFKEINSTNYTVLQPDAGAQKRTETFCKVIEYNDEIITCMKSRGVDGKITKTIVPMLDLTKDIIMVDDICDGGRTFIEIANVIKERLERFERLNGTPGKLNLIVTHGIFSKGLNELYRYFDGIYCTNSYSQHSEVKQFNLF